MIEILSLPRRPTINLLQINNPNYKPGLPINSLPGWEHIPLNSKLPMLKCPGNQVIFSKNKIGQSFSHLKQEFDPCGHDNFPEYNPLHDSNLRTFYANERNLKRLRENGEITDTNDVICTLKDFNEYREQLHKSHLYYVLQEINRLEVEQHDRLLIANAESVTNRDHRNLNARQHSYNEILARKKMLDEQRAEYFKRQLEKTEEKFQRITGLTQMRRVLIEHRRVLNNLKMQQHWDVCNDLQRKHLITQKKRFQFKTDRLKKNLQLHKEQRKKKAEEAQISSWQSRLNERIMNQEKMKHLLDYVITRRRMYIENHRIKYSEIWGKIQDEVKQRSDQSKKHKEHTIRRRVRRKKRSSVPKTESQPFCATYQASFEKLLDADLCEVLNAAIDIQGNIKLPFSSNDPIYKAATFIMHHILAKFKKDLSGDKAAFNFVAERINTYFIEAKKFVLFRATQIIASTRASMKGEKKTRCSVSSFQSGRRPTLPKYVSFSNIMDTIGMSSYEINPLIDVKQVTDRVPTPPGSLASIVVHSKEDIVETTTVEHLCRNERIFIEYYMIKFKRELIVGMGKRVFAAIHCHFENNIMDVRKELLEIDRKFLVNQMTKSILSYPLNPLNFESCIKLCISALSSDLIWSLQKHLLRPLRDPRSIVAPRQCCPPESDRMKLCLYCYPK